MKKLLSLGVLSLLVGMTFIGMTVMTLADSQDHNNVIQDRFVGAWRLASLEQQGADGKNHKATAEDQGEIGTPAIVGGRFTVGTSLMSETAILRQASLHPSRGWKYCRVKLGNYAGH